MIKTRLAKPEEAEKIVNWMAQQDPGSVPDMGSSTLALVAENGELRGAMPINLGFLICSMPMNPENRHRETVISLAKLLDAALSLACGVGVKDLYFVATTKEIEEQAIKNGFEEIPYPVMRRRL